MAGPRYRNNGGAALVGDLCRGWLSAEMDAEVAGVVIDAKPDQEAGANLTLAVLEFDEYPHGAPVPGEREMGLRFGNNAGNTCDVYLRTVEVDSNRMELVLRRTDLEGWRGLLRTPDEGARRLRLESLDSQQRQREAAAGVTPARPVVGAPPAPLPAPRPDEGKLSPPGREPAAVATAGGAPPPPDEPAVRDLARKDEPKKGGK